jgi:alanyl-tRNA synthetase
VAVPLSLDQLRSKYLNFFSQKQHALVPSAPLVPENDATTLFISSGMQPLLEYFLGAVHPLGSRVVNSQKCFRSQDIEEVGDNRHTTFFEMLGNWSFGDYFKTEQIQFVFEFLTNDLNLDPNRLYVTVFGGSAELHIEKDEEAIVAWQKQFSTHNVDSQVILNPAKTGLGEGRICVYQWENWWSRAGKPSAMPVGEPGGPDSEVFYDFGINRHFHENSKWKDLPCHLNCDCGRFMEIGNSVFMQYMKQTDGSFVELPKKNVDFGGGLERILAAIHNEPDVFALPIFEPVIKKLEQLSGKKYQEAAQHTKAFRVIVDHLRAAVMLISDGVNPSNKDQGYVVRRLIRRAVRYAHVLGIEDLFLAQLVSGITNLYQDQYPELSLRQKDIEQSLNQEEGKFRRTLIKGEQQLKKMLTEKNNNKLSNISAQDAFYLYESFGFPLELTQEIISEAYPEDTLVTSNDFSQEFQKLRQQHSTSSRSASAGQFKGGLQNSSQITTRYHTATHLLHASLRKQLGKQVQQKGSHITDQRLRFDFSYDQPIDENVLKIVVDQINQWVQADLPVHCQEMLKSEALKQGALAFFVEKYPEKVTVYTIGSDPNKDWISKELCGGPHVQQTSQIGTLAVIKEQSIGAGIRRIYLRFVE